MKRILLCFAVVLIGNGLGCTAGLQQIPGAPGKEHPVHSAPPQSPTNLEHRLRYLNQMLEADTSLRDEERETIRKLIDVCSRLRGLHAGGQPQPGTESADLAMQAVELAVQLLEETRPLKEALESGTSSERAVRDFLDTERDILAAYRDGRPLEVIDRSLELVRAYGPGSLRPEILRVFAWSLAREGMVEEAVEMGGYSLRASKDIPETTLFRSELARWYWSLGQKNKAKQIHQTLAKRAVETEALLSRLESELSEDVLAAESEPSMAPRLSGDARVDGKIAEACPELASVLGQVDRLIGRSAYDQAKLVLIKHRLRSSDERRARILDQAMQQVESAEQEAERKREVQTAARRKQLERARTLIEKEKYEEAFSELETFRAISEEGDEAEALRERALEGLINRERNRAARLFLKAKETDDPGRKEEYLRSSYRILKSLVDKYPSNSLSEKVRSNLKIVEEALRGIT